MIGMATLANVVWEYRRKLHLEIFRTYADKYNSILTPEIYGKWQAALKGDQQHWTELNFTMIKYLNLIWEEFYLSRERVIPRRLWRIWLPEIDRVLATEFAKTMMKANDFHFPDLQL